MLLLAADTSGRDGSIGLVRGEADGTCKLIESVRLDGGAFSAQLVSHIAALLSKHGFNKEDIGGFVVVSGPGSFTGLRVGLAAFKALAEVLVKPVAAVSLLEAVALAGGPTGNVMTALDAGRRQIYVGEYEVLSGGARRINESLVTRNEFPEMVRGANVITPDPSLAALAQTVEADARVIAAPVIGFIAELGWRKMRAGETVSPENLEANYISQPHAAILTKSGC